MFKCNQTFQSLHPPKPIPNPPYNFYQ
jgi:hypothetical protein